MGHYRYSKNRYRMPFRLCLFFMTGWILTYLCVDLLSDRRLVELTRLSALRGNPDFYYSDTIDRYDKVAIVGDNLTSWLLKSAALNETTEEFLLNLRSNYVNKVRQWVAPLLAGGRSDNFHMVQYRCDTPWKCGGLGDRFRGMVATFYMAVFADAVYDCQWVQPDYLGRYFSINSFYYGFADDVQYHQAFQMQPQLTLADANFIDNEKSIKNRFGLLYNVIRNHSVTRIRLNSLLPLEKMPTDANFLKKMTEYNATLAMSYDVIVSAAMRFLLARPDPSLSFFVSDMVEKMGSSDSFKIGVQLRVEIADWSEDGRITFQQISCFVEKVHKIMEAHRQEDALQRNVSVFISADSTGAADRFTSQLQELDGSVKFFRLNGKITHLDRLPLKDGISQHEMWQLNARTFADWLLLTQMDLLVISRSGFGETAAIFSLQPTLRFLHRPSTKKHRCVFEKYNLKTLHMDPS